MTNSSNKVTDPLDRELEEVLDGHAENYARLTKRFIMGEITEEERNAQWKESDIEAKSKLKSLLAKRERGARVDELIHAAIIDGELMMEYIGERPKGEQFISLADRLKELTRLEEE